MRKLTFLLLTVLSFAASAQTYHPGALHVLNRKTRQPAFLVNLLNRQMATATSQKATGTIRERLIGAAAYNPAPLVLVDSVTLKYSGNRGSKYDYYMQNYNYIGTPYDSHTPLFDYPGFSSKQSILADTVSELTRDSLTTPLYQGTLTYATYDGNNNQVNYYAYIDTTHTNDYRYYNTYNASGAISSSINFTWSTGWDTAAKRYFTYNSSNQLIQDSSYTYSSGSLTPYIKITYDYDSKGNVVKASNYTWQPALKVWNLGGDFSMTYTADNKILTFSQDTGASSSPVYRDTFGYTSGSSFITYTKEQYWLGTAAGWYDIYTETAHLNANGFPDTTLINYSSSTPPILITEAITYNSFNDPDTAYIFVAQGGSSQLAENGYYYYEKYNDNTAVPEAALNTNDIQLFPNPATNLVNIKMTGTPATRLYVKLVNVTGQLVRTENIPVHSPTEQISIADLNPGVYFISIQDQAGKLLHSQQIIKR